MKVFLLALALSLLPAVVGLSQTAGRDPVAGDPGIGGRTLVDFEYRVTTTGILRFWRAYSSEGARVMLKVWRPEGGRLVLVGTSALEAVPGAEVTTFETAIPVSRNDIIGCFCPDDLCVDRFTDGAALTIGGDVGTRAVADFTSETGGPALFAGTTLGLDIPSRAARNLVLPIAARTPGSNGTTWSTSLELFNTAVDPAQVALSFNRSGVDNTQPAATAHLEVPARGVLTLDDLLLAVFNLEVDVGSVDVVSSQPVIAHGRIFNDGGGGGTFGQLVPALPAAWALGDDDAPGVGINSDIAYLFEVVEDDDWRTNVGVANVSAVPLEVRLQAFVGTSVVGDGLDLELAPYSHVQVNRVLIALGVPPQTQGVRLNVAVANGCAARFLAYASRVDNLSGDAVYLQGEREPSLPSVVAARVMR